jgi:hypothetical protein
MFVQAHGFCRDRDGKLRWFDAPPLLPLPLDEPLELLSRIVSTLTTSLVRLKPDPTPATTPFSPPKGGPHACHKTSLVRLKADPTPATNP